MTKRRHRCDLYIFGHCLHWIQARKASDQPHRWGRAIEVTDGVIVVEYLDKIGRYRNHDPKRVQQVVQVGSTVRVCERYGVLTVEVDYRTTGGFCIADADEPWTPCSFEPLSEATPEALAERLKERGGFSIPAQAVVDLNSS